MILASETDKHWNRGYISGTFDMFHIGHLNLIRRAKERCNFLIVGVLTDELVMSYKKKWPVIPMRDRLEIVGSLKYVDETDVTSPELMNKVNAWNKYKFDAMFSGDDHAGDGWAHEDSQLSALGAELVFFPYTKEVSSSSLQESVLPPKADNADKAKKIEPFTHLFPFNKVKAGERIVVFGMGNIGKQYARQVAALDFCEIVALTDTYAHPGDMFEGFACIMPDELRTRKNEFDRIVIASIKYHGEILGKLRALGIEPGDIV